MIDYILISKALGVASAVSGAIGTTLLFKGSFAFEPVGSFYTDAETTRITSARNRKRLLLQRTGLGFLMLSFILAGLSVIAN